MTLSFLTGNQPPLNQPFHRCVWASERVQCSVMSTNIPDRQRFNLDRVVRGLISVCTIVAVVALLRYLADVLIPFVVAILIAYLLNPIVNTLESRLRHRGAAVLVTMLTCALLAMAGIFVIVPIVGTQLHDFERLVKELRRDVAPADGGVVSADAESDGGEVKPSLADRFEALLQQQEHPRVAWVLGKVKEFVTSDAFDLQAALVSIGRKLVPGVWDVVTGAVSFVIGLTGLVVIFLYVVFLLNDFRIVERTWKDLLPPGYRSPIIEFLHEFRLAMERYFRGQFIVAACCGVLFAIGFSLIDLRMAIVLGLMMGVLNMIPYAQVVGLIPALLLGVLRAVEQSSGVAVSLGWVLLVFAVVQIIQDAFLVPRIMGKATGLRPAIIILGIFIWGKLLGFLGVVIAIPLTCMGLAYYRRFVLKLSQDLASPPGKSV